MRERTPSADDSPPRAPPIPSTPPTPPNPPVISPDTTSAKLLGIDPGITLGPVICPTTSLNRSVVPKNMVASSHSLEELGVSHPASASGDRGLSESNRTAQTALDKRSRLSNVINNLRKKVPESSSQTQTQQQQQQQQQHQRQESQQQRNESDSDGRNSLERNLETLEKYVMTVLNGVIKDEAEDVAEDRIEESSTSCADDAKDDEEGAKPEKDAEEALEGAKNEAVNDPVVEEEDSEKKHSNETEDDSESEKLMDACRELMNDLLNDINNLIERKAPPDRDPEPEDNRVQIASPTSLHCSLPLEKVAPMLRSCQDYQPVTFSQSPQRSPSRPSPPMVRHLCLYCDRKFLSISLRQRHAERVHQVGGASRRSERNSRRTVQTCQYCSEKVVGDASETPESPEAVPCEIIDTLDGLFKHMVRYHPDRYYACVQCSTRYATRESLANHATEAHNTVQEKDKEAVVTRVKEQLDETLESVKKEAFVSPGSPDFDSSFYSSVSCNIRENLLHHLDGKLQANSTLVVIPVVEVKPQQQQQQQNFYESNAAQIQLPIDISLTAATPVYNKEYSNDGNENSSEYAQRPGKTRTHPRRVSFEKYNFPRKYDGKEPWSCSIKDLSKFDISTQLTLRKKQQLSDSSVGLTTGVRQVGQTDIDVGTSAGEETPVGDAHDALGTASVPSEESSPNSPRCSDLNLPEIDSKTTMFTSEFASFMRLKRWDEVVNGDADHRKVVYAELTGEWSRPRIYICGACAERHVTLKEMEEHKSCTHPNVWCSHFEFAGDQRDLYKHLFLPGKGSPTATARAAISPEKICTKCSKNCNTLAELHRHMLECAGDQTWLLGLFGNGKKKCKWRPFGSRSRRRRQRGMKRNIQNSQTPRANTPKDRQANGPRVRPSDLVLSCMSAGESIQKMLANLPPKRASRKVLREENLARSRREAAQTVQTRSRPRISTDVTSSAVQSRNKTVLKNKLLKNAKSFQRNRTRIDNIAAAIESVVTCRLAQSTSETKSTVESVKRGDESGTRMAKIQARNVMAVLSKKKNVKTKVSTIANMEHPRTRGRPFGAIRVSSRSKVNVVPEKPALKSGKPPNPKNQAPQQQAVGAKPPKNSGEAEEAGVIGRKKKVIDPVASMHASLKAKQQLRTNDGKFARSPNHSSDELPTQERYPRRHASIPRFVIPKSRIKATKEVGKKKTAKITGRVPSDGDRMPTLEPAVPVRDSELSGPEEEPEIPGRGNELPVLSPAAIGTVRRTSRASDKKDPTIEDHLDLDDVLEKSVIDVAELKNKYERENASQRKAESEKKGVRGPRSKRKTQVALSSFSASSSSLTRVKEKKNLPKRSVSVQDGYRGAQKKPAQTLVESKEIKQNPRRSGRTSSTRERRGNDAETAQDQKAVEAVEEGRDKNNTNKNPTEYKESPRRSERTSSIKDRRDEIEGSRDEPSTTLKNREKAEDAGQKQGLVMITSLNGCKPNPRQCGRTSSAKDHGEEIYAAQNQPRSSKSRDKVTEIRDDGVSAKPQGKSGRKSAQKATGENHAVKKLADHDQPISASDAEGPHLQGKLDPEEEEHSGLPKRGRGLGKRRGRIKAPEVIEKHTDEDEEAVIESPINLSLERLQRESSNSNVDSGKENSSETPIMVPKPRAVRPKKTKTGRTGRDRLTKRLGSVIGILTEGVNIPVEAQQSVVLTVQTASVNAEPATSGSQVKPEKDAVVEDKASDEEKGPVSDEALLELETRRGIDAMTGCAEKVESKSDKPEDSNDPEKNQVVQEAVPSGSCGTQATVEPLKKFEPVPGEKMTNQVELQVPFEPSNDIIMDLSRRKPKGKGSFLEKIVSKIAKQKDVLLVEGDVGSLLDNAVDELTNILDEVAPNLTESTENLTTSVNDTQARSDKAAGLSLAEKSQGESSRVEKEDEDAVPTLRDQSEAVKVCIADFVPVDDVGPTLDEDRLITTSASDNLVIHTSNEPKAKDNVKKNDDVTVSKKRAIETSTPKKNKRKSVDAEAINEVDDLPTDELCLADIMKLIQKPKTNGEKENETVARPGKRKTVSESEPRTKGRTEDLEIGLEISATEDSDSKRPKRRSCVKTSLIEEHLPLLIDDLEKTYDDDETFTKNINKRKNLQEEDAAVIELEANQVPRSNSALNNRAAKRRLIETSRQKTDDGSESSQEPERRSSKRKSSLANEKPDTCAENDFVSSENDKRDENSGSKAKNIKRITGEAEESQPDAKLEFSVIEACEKKIATKKRKCRSKSEEKSSRDDESKIEETLEESKKMKTSRSTPEKIPSLVNEHLDLDDEDSTALSEAETPADSLTKAKPESPQIFHRLRTLRQRNPKRKSLAEDHLELFDDGEEVNTEPFKVPEVGEAHHSRTRRSSKRSLNVADTEALIGSANGETISTKRKSSAESLNSKAVEVGQDLETAIINRTPKSNTPIETETPDETANSESLEPSLIKEHLDLSDKNEEEVPIDDPEESDGKLNESIPVSETDVTTEISAEDDQLQQIPKKRGTANFAVGHTKNGEILIVEKKKKLTKEAARFFCEVCATSFTRKSSLKKHNLSQSHLVQIAKSEKNSEIEIAQGEEAAEKEDPEDEDRTRDYWGSEDSLDDVDETPVVDPLGSNPDDTALHRAPRNPLTPQISEEEALEEELLDEEICKITENMTHDDFVLTDHISPEPDTAVSVTVKSKNLKKDELPALDAHKAKKRRNLAEEHLDLDSPSPQPKLNKETDLEPSPPESPIFGTDTPCKSVSRTENLSLEFRRPGSDPEESDLAEKTKEASPGSLQKTDGTDLPAVKHPLVSIPVKIQRDVLASSNLNIDDDSSSDRPLAEILSKSRNSQLSEVFNQKVEELSVSSKTKKSTDPHLGLVNATEKPNGSKSRKAAAEFESDESAINTEVSVDVRKLLKNQEVSDSKPGESQREVSPSNDKFENEKPSVRKVQPRKSRSVRPKRRRNVTPSSGSESSEAENMSSDSRNKNKIVKSVFGRVFGGEKSEKVQDKVKEVLDDWDSRSDDDVRRRGASLSSEDSKKRRNRSRAKTREDEKRANGESRVSRRSKKRAEERISKAFEEEAVSVGNQNGLSENGHEELVETTKEERAAKPGADEWPIFGTKSEISDTKQPLGTGDERNVVSEAENSMNRASLPEWASLLPSPSPPSSPAQSSVAPSSVRNRSPTPDRNSQSSDSSESEDDGPRCRLSPLYIRNTPDTSMDSVASDANGDFVADDKAQKKLPLVDTPVVKLAEEHQVVTIAPTDALEDNAIDVPRPALIHAAASLQKPRQVKVLNCDEKLFVECCSRLKTSENELRGAKKIQLDHSDAYRKKDTVDGSGFRSICDRFRDAESQNSLGSLLESVNQLLGEERYANNEKDYSKHATHHRRSENSSRSVSPDLEASCILPDNLGYEDSLDVAFEHNNKLRDKIQQRMRESENLIASSFPREANNPTTRHPSHGDLNSPHGVAHPASTVHADEPRIASCVAKGLDDHHHHHTSKNASLESAGFKQKMTSTLGGLLDKLALSNLLHDTTKHDHNGSTPMTVLAELACARAPSATKIGELEPKVLDSMPTDRKDIPIRRIRNPIKELFERKKELNDRNQSDRTRAVVVAVAALKELNVHRHRNKNTTTAKKARRQQRSQEFPLVRKSPYSGMAEKKKRRDISSEKKEPLVIRSDKVKDVYDFDDEESQAEVAMPSVVSFRSKVTPLEVDVASLASKAIVQTLDNGKEADILGRRLESMIDRKFKEVEKSAPKTKGALKAFQNDRGAPKDAEIDPGTKKAKEPSDVKLEDQAAGPMDDFVQRGKQGSKRNSEFRKRSKSKKRGKTSRKKSRPSAWYENDSSDEFITAAKTEDVGVGISKSQRTCSKGKQNLFAELSSTSSESEEEVELDYDCGSTDVLPDEIDAAEKPTRDKSPNDRLCQQTEEHKTRNYSETKKSESEMSDHPLVIDERRESDEESNARNNYEPSFEMDDLYREDSSDEGDAECPVFEEVDKVVEDNSEVLPKSKFLKEDELIPLEEALDLLDQPGTLEESTSRSKDKGKKFLTDRETEGDNISVAKGEELVENYAGSPTNEKIDEDETVQLPEKLPGNEKPEKASDNLPLHVFLSRKVQESKKRKQQHLKKLQEEQERILLELQPTRRQRKCAIGKQGLLAEISSSSSDEGGSGLRKYHDKDRSSDTSEKPRRQKRESREKRKERYIEKKHEQIIAKEQKAIQEEILRELGKKKDGRTTPVMDSVKSFEGGEFDQDEIKEGAESKMSPKKQKKQKPQRAGSVLGDSMEKTADTTREKTCINEPPSKTKKQSKPDQKSPKKTSSSSSRSKKHSTGGKSAAEFNGKETKDSKDRRSSGMKRDSTDEELRTTKSWNKVEEGVGVAIGRRKRAAANQLYYWSSSSDEEEEIVEEPLANAEEEDDRQEQHGWIVGDSHKRMITMLAMEKQLKEKRRRSEDEFEPNKAKNKKHRNSTS
ncbi:uncharacterized protein LOC107221539 isoform X1 [Neodiprion lecontei]|uniref:Uncharacterized protein LOC107221539 isoform X1 n=1 Tax=Neodiprion lecontei TaxID=441921 RepID=A0ABM3FWF7_NEOLC|nr:uncharacterized protein LOC107221539 isoform X1 [Neodiprion lecontei]